jgi:hypothetical protein
LIPYWLYKQANKQINRWVGRDRFSLWKFHLTKNQNQLTPPSLIPRISITKYFWVLNLFFFVSFLFYTDQVCWCTSLSYIRFFGTQWFFPLLTEHFSFPFLTSSLIPGFTWYLETLFQLPLFWYCIYFWGKKF